jgi:putative hemolysin
VRIHDQADDIGAQAQLHVGLAESADEVRDALQLRYAVFAEELGAQLADGIATGIDRDRFDAHCDHLVVRCGAAVVGTYRILPPEGRRRAGGWYCADEFDVAALAPFADQTIEVGRACVHPAFRSGRAISLLWTGLLRYVLRRGGRYVIGCASLGTEDGGHLAASICRRLLQDHRAPAPWRVTPHRAFVLEGWKEIADAQPPGLLKGYLHLGAVVCGAPAWDPAFNTADLLLMLPVDGINNRYVERLLRA